MDYSTGRPFDGDAYEHNPATRNLLPRTGSAAGATQAGGEPKPEPGDPGEKGGQTQPAQPAEDGNEVGDPHEKVPTLPVQPAEDDDEDDADWAQFGRRRVPRLASLSDALAASVSSPGAASPPQQHEPVDRQP